MSLHDDMMSPQRSRRRQLEENKWNIPGTRKVFFSLLCWLGHRARIYGQRTGCSHWHIRSRHLLLSFLLPCVLFQTQWSLKYVSSLTIAWYSVIDSTYHNYKTCSCTFSQTAFSHCSQ